MKTKKFTFLSTVVIADDVSTKYRNYDINGFTPKTLAKRFVPSKSEKGSLKEFGFEYKSKSAKAIKTLFVVQEIGAVGNTIKNITVALDKQTAEDFILSYQPSQEATMVVNELNCASMGLYYG